METEMKMKQYAVWEVDGDCSYWTLYDSLEDAVSSAGDGVEIYRMTAKFVGRFRRKAALVRLPKKKRPKKAKTPLALLWRKR